MALGESARETVDRTFPPIATRRAKSLVKAFYWRSEAPGPRSSRSTSLGGQSEGASMVADTAGIRVVLSSGRERSAIPSLVPHRSNADFGLRHVERRQVSQEMWRPIPPATWTRILFSRLLGQPQTTTHLLRNGPKSCILTPVLSSRDHMQNETSADTPGYRSIPKSLGRHRPTMALCCAWHHAGAPR